MACCPTISTAAFTPALAAEAAAAFSFLRSLANRWPGPRSRSIASIPRFAPAPAAA
uniref:Uncharacterized protein n=1 Tax=Arundo donax TaxID=35708 RepID=A0A0A9BKS5_ARUDO